MKTKERMEHSITLLTGMIFGAVAMYVFDEHRGAKRRAQVRDKLVHAARVVTRGVSKRSRDVAHRIGGSVAEIRSSIKDKWLVTPDEILMDRVRAHLGHVVSHPSLLEIRALRGCVLVTGTVMPEEVEKIDARLKKIRGVREYDLDLERRSDLQQVSGRKGSRREAI